MSAFWDEELKLLLLTPEEFAALPDGEVLTCIDDTTAIKGQEPVDDDTRMGHLSCGVVGNHPLRVAALEAIVVKARQSPPALPLHSAWSCKIGVAGKLVLPPGADLPMRRAVERAFKEVTGLDDQFNFSGWGAQLDAVEFACAFERSAGQ